MKVVILTSGSRGDVQPYVVLGLELARRGHEVVVATEARMERLVTQLGGGVLAFHKIAGDPTAMLFSKESQVRESGLQQMQQQKQRAGQHVERAHQRRLPMNPTGAAGGGPHATRDAGC